MAQCQDAFGANIVPCMIYANAGTTMTAAANMNTAGVGTTSLVEFPYWALPPLAAKRCQKWSLRLSSSAVSDQFLAIPRARSMHPAGVQGGVVAKACEQQYCIWHTFWSNSEAW